MKELFVKYPKEMMEELESIKHLEHIGESRHDSKPIYKLTIPIPNEYRFISKMEIRYKKEEED